MGLRLPSFPMQPEIGPEGGPDEAHVADGDGGPVEQGHAAGGAVERQHVLRLRDLRAVILVVAGHMEDVPDPLPDASHLTRGAPFGGGQVARHDDDVGARRERRDAGAAELEMEVGEELDAHVRGVLR